MKKNVIKCLAFVVMIMALSLCFAGCDFLSGNNNSTSKKIEAIGLVGNIKTEYYLNEELDLQEAKIKVIYEDDTSKNIELLQSMVSNFSTKKTGSFTLTITYKSKTIQKKYTVNLSASAVVGTYIGTSTDTVRHCHTGTDELVDENSEEPLFNISTNTSVVINDSGLTWSLINSSYYLNATYKVVNNTLVCKVVLVSGTSVVPDESSYSLTITFEGDKLIVRSNGIVGGVPNDVDVIYTYTKSN